MSKNNYKPRPQATEVVTGFPGVEPEVENVTEAVAEEAVPEVVNEVVEDTTEAVIEDNKVEEVVEQEVVAPVEVPVKEVVEESVCVVDVKADNVVVDSVLKTEFYVKIDSAVSDTLIHNRLANVFSNIYKANANVVIGPYATQEEAIKARKTVLGRGLRCSITTM